MLEKIWPFGKLRLRKAVEEALERAFEPGEAIEPLSELVEEEGRYLLRVEVPGMEKEHLQVRLEGPYLVVEGERREEKRKKHLAEIVYGRVFRQYLLPPDAKAEGVRARLKNGVLEVEIPREKAEAKAVQIPVE